MQPPILFWQWIYRNKENNRLLWFTLVAMTISFAWLKIIYPFPNFMPPDSNNYLEAAYNNDLINVWPIGYSKFLRLISSFSNSHFVLVTVQYLLIIASVLYFLFTIRYLLFINTWLFRVLFILSVSNPLLPHIANFISSDCLFTSFAILWFTQLLWIMYNPSKKLLLLHSAVLLLAFTIRFSALYLPFISIGTILLTSMTKKLKGIGVGCISLLLLLFIGRTQYEYKIKTDTIQFAAFSGWQLAANALYGYAHADLDSINTVPKKFKELHAVVNQHIDSIRTLAIRPDKKIGIYYLWNFKSPLRVFTLKYEAKLKERSFFQKWSLYAPKYFDYGKYLIIKHPWLFIRYFVLPNLIRFYAPPAYFMEKYNFGFNTVAPIAVTWFDWGDNKLPTRNKDRRIKLMSAFPNIIAILNSFFLIFSLAFIAWVGFKKLDIITKRLIICSLSVWWANLIFSVLSAPIELRYELFSIIIMTPFAGVFLERVIHSLHPISTNSMNLTIPATEILR